MTIKTKTEYLSKTLLDIYDSANSISENNRKGNEDLFYEIAQEHEILLAGNAGNISGWLSYTINARKQAFISGLYVAREHQRKGIAGQLMNELKGCAPDCVLWAKVLKNSAWAREFYLKNGFAALDEDSVLSSELGQPVKDEPWALVFARA